MREKGQLQLEAIICFALFLGMLGLFLANINEATKQAEQALQGLKAKTETLVCCLAADTIYSSGVAELFSDRMSCTASQSLVKSRFGKKTKQSSCLAEEIRLIQSAKKSVLEVKPSEHYR